MPCCQKLPFIRFLYHEYLVGEHALQIPHVSNVIGPGFRPCHGAAGKELMGEPWTVMEISHGDGVQCLIKLQLFCREHHATNILQTHCTCFSALCVPTQGTETCGRRDELSIELDLWL